MPIARCKNREPMSIELLSVAIQHWNDGIALGHTERTARKKVVLDADDDQCITLTQPFYVSLHDSPPIRANRASELRPGVAPGARPARSGLPERRQRPPDIPVSICKIGVCTLRPRACIRELWVPEVPDCELRSGGCAMAHVEAEKR